MNNDVQTESRASMTTAHRRKSVTASTAGNVLEWYEWSAYAAFAPFIARAMFGEGDPFSALLSTLAIFAVGFLMRPLGGIIFGRVADRRGRKFVLMLTVLMMAAGGLVIGIMPTYETIGAAASVILLVVRMLQGLAHGGETATAYSYIGEIAPAAQRGRYGSVVFAAVFAGSVLAYTVGGVVSSSVDVSALAAWGWRIPFLLGAVLALVALYMRRTMDESEEFKKQSLVNELTPVPRPVVIKASILIIALTGSIAAAHYTWTSFASTYAITEKGLDPQVAYWSAVGAQLIALISLPFWGALSDRIGRRPMYLGFAALMLILQFPLTMLISDNGWTLFIAMGLGLVLVAIPAAVITATMTEILPTRVRAQAIGFSFSVSVALFGGTAPYLNQFFLGLGIGPVFGLYIIVLCLVTGAAAFFMKETNGNPLVS